MVFNHESFPSRPGSGGIQSPDQTTTRSALVPLNFQHNVIISASLVLVLVPVRSYVGDSVQMSVFLLAERSSHVIDSFLVWFCLRVIDMNRVGSKDQNLFRSQREDVGL